MPSDGRKDKVFAAAAFAEVIDAWRAQHGDLERPVNARDLFDHLVRVHGYGRSYKSVLHYVRARYGRPPIRTYRRVQDDERVRGAGCRGRLAEPGPARES